jgi:hypothetical protein
MTQHHQLTWLKTSIVLVYSSNRFVDQLGDDRSILPLSGKETSSLQYQRQAFQTEADGVI